MDETLVSNVHQCPQRLTVQLFPCTDTSGDFGDESGEYKPDSVPFASAVKHDAGFFERSSKNRKLLVVGRLAFHMSIISCHVVNVAHRG